MNVTIEHAKKLIEVSKSGLCKGLGSPEPGKMCVMAAINYVMGNPHDDKPTCVHPVVRSFDIKLNDSRWSSNEARAKGMIREGVAKLGSTDIDGQKFAEYVSIETVKRIVPIALRAAAKLNPKFAHELEAVAVGCETVKTHSEAHAASRQAAEVARKVRAYAYAYAAAAAAAEAAADAAAYAAAYAYAYAAAEAEAAADAAAAAEAAADAAAYAYAERDRVLTISAEIATEALILCGSQGAQWLYLLDEQP